MSDPYSNYSNYVTTLAPSFIQSSKTITDKHSSRLLCEGYANKISNEPTLCFVVCFSIDKHFDSCSSKIVWGEHDLFFGGISHYTVLRMSAGFIIEGATQFLSTCCAYRNVCGIWRYATVSEIYSHVTPLDTCPSLTCLAPYSSYFN